MPAILAHSQKRLTLFRAIGVLAIPSVFHTLGLAPGIIILVVIGALTTYADWYIGMFKLKHPQVCEFSDRFKTFSLLLGRALTSTYSPLDSVSDCGQLMFGKVGGELFGIAYWLRESFSARLSVKEVLILLSALQS